MTAGNQSAAQSFEMALPNEAASLALARCLAGRLRAGDVVFLIGDLGTGKTTLARGLINALPLAQAAGSGAVDEDVPSPTFTLVQIYERRPAPVWHVDLYRLERPEEVEELGLDEAAGEAITVVEWPERLGERVPADRLEVRLRYAEASEARSVELVGFGGWRARLGEIRSEIQAGTRAEIQPASGASDGAAVVEGPRGRVMNHG